jgi:phosphatidylglycerol:prolipoprotein diacylglycerol transferase
VAPILLEVDLGGGVVTLPAYGTLLAIAAGVAVLLVARALVSLGASQRRALIVCAFAVGSGLVGARLASVAFEARSYISDPSAIVALEARGLALYGGFAGGVTAMALAVRWLRLPGWSVADASVPAVAVGIALVRIGCFLAGCCPGAPTDLAWGVEYPIGAGPSGLPPALGAFLGIEEYVGPVHPTQLYEAVAALVCLAVALVVRGRATRPGTAALVFAVGFLAFRVANQGLREPTPGAFLGPEATLMLDLVVAVVALVFLGRHLGERAGRGMNQYLTLPRSAAG